MRIFELRKNPEQNPKINPGKYIGDLVHQNPDTQYWVSMTKLDKLGINPKSSYGTPIGVYGYPGMYVSRKTDSGYEGFDRLPFAGNSPYINVFTVSGNVVDLDDMSDDTLEHYLSALKSQIVKRDLIKGPETSDYTTYVDRKIHEFRQESYENTRHQGEYPGEVLWYVTMRIASDIKVDRTVIWNKLFRLIGIDAAYSHEGIIHPNEPQSIVVFNPKVINLIKRFSNTPSTMELEKRRKDGKDNDLMTKLEGGSRQALAKFKQAPSVDDSDDRKRLVMQHPEILPMIDQYSRSHLILNSIGNRLFRGLEKPTIEDYKAIIEKIKRYPSAPGMLNMDTDLATRIDKIQNKTIRDFLIDYYIRELSGIVDQYVIDNYFSA